MTQSIYKFIWLSVFMWCNFTIGPKSSEVTFECLGKNITWSPTLFSLVPVLQVQHGLHSRCLVGKIPTCCRQVLFLKIHARPTKITYEETYHIMSKPLCNHKYTKMWLQLQISFYPFVSYFWIWSAAINLKMCIAATAWINFSLLPHKRHSIFFSFQ